jgi:lipoate-protein ligase B
LIIPCGIADYEVGSITGILGKTVDMEYAGNILADKFAEIFSYDVEDIRDLEDIMKLSNL